MKWLPAAIAVVGLIVWMLIPGKPEVNRYVPNTGDGYTTPTMATTDVSTFISDSGYTKYHLTADLWQLFEDADEPFWRFPAGLYMEQYDKDMKLSSSVVCDSATYLSRKRVWQLDGNVIMVNTDADSFLTQQLFWDQNARKIYSDSFIHIVRSDRTIEGYGFESDQSMKYYTVHRPTAILPAEMKREKDKDKTVQDSVHPERTEAPRERASEKAQTAKTLPTYEVEDSPDKPTKRRRNLEPIESKPIRRK
ncbi:MAG: LPS export ABC transporter periplasmic protein LptC [Bacteroidales bacterium]|nr:LPS export ABC transporter periplasmic protein LptC [Bacteroidales bacterium]